MTTTKIITDSLGFETTLPVYESAKDAIIDLEFKLTELDGFVSKYSIVVNSGSRTYLIPEGFGVVGIGAKICNVNEKGNSVNRTVYMYALYIAD